MYIQQREVAIRKQIIDNLHNVLRFCRSWRCHSGKLRFKLKIGMKQAY